MAVFMLRVIVHHLTMGCAYCKGCLEMADFEEFVAQVELIADGALPADYREWLRRHESGASAHRQTPFDLQELLSTQRIVQDVIPPKTLAIGDDGHGNLILLRLSDGSIEWWCHEREAGDFQTETIRPSFSDYLHLIAEGES